MLYFVQYAAVQALHTLPENFQIMIRDLEPERLQIFLKTELFKARTC